jgi:hypothetical protein
MSACKRPDLTLRILFVLAVSAGAIGSIIAIPGCSGRGAPYTLSDDARAKAKEVWKRKSLETDAKTSRSSRR